MEEREAELVPVPYFHIVFTLPAAIGDIAYQNKAVIYDLLFKASSEALLNIAADPMYLGAKIGITALLHTWGSAMTHHPHVHMIVPGGGFSTDKSKWVAAKPQFFLPVFVLSKLFRRLMLEKLSAAHAQGKLTFFGTYTHLTDADQFAAFLAPLRKTRWFVYAKRPFAGPKAVLAYLPRYTHRVAISNSRLITAEAGAGDLQGQEQSRRGRRSLYHHDAAGGRVHLPPADPRPAHRLAPHPSLRLPGQRRQGGQSGQGPRTAGCARAEGRHRRR